MRRLFRAAAVLAVIGVLIWLAAGGPDVRASERRLAAFAAPPGAGPVLEPGEALVGAGPGTSLFPRNKLAAEYVWVRDSDDTMPARGAVVYLALSSAKGKMVILATLPDEVQSIEGTYAARGGQVQINIPEWGFKTKGKYSLSAAGELVLPFLLINEGKGTSTWRRRDFSANPSALGAYLLRDASLSDLKPGPAIRAIAGRLRGMPGVVSAQVNGEGTGIVVSYREKVAGEACPACGGVPPVRQDLINGIAMAPFVPGTRDKPLLPPAGQYYQSYFQTTRDPVPATDADDPAKKTALIVVPFHDQHHYDYRRPLIPLIGQLIWGPQVTGDTGAFRVTVERVYKELTAKGGYDYVDGVVAALKRAGFAEGNIKILKDDKVTVGNLFNELKKGPGFIIIDSHGGMLGNESVFMTGEQLKGVGLEGEDEVRDAINKYRNSLPPAIRKAVLFSYDGVAPDVGIAVKADFIKAARDAGRGFSSSAVIAVFCHSASSPHVREAFGAASFVGVDGTINVFAGAIFADFLVDSLAEKTHTPQYGLDLLLDANEFNLFWPFGEKYEIPLQKIGKENYTILRGYGSRGPYERLDAQVLAVISMMRESSVLSGDAVTGGGVDECYEKYWSRKKLAGLAAPWCDRGHVGDFPTGDDVELAKGEIIGQPLLPAGRYTLNDAER